MTPCKDIESIPSSKPDVISSWIVTEVDSHGKCIMKSKLTVDYLEMLKKYENDNKVLEDGE